MRPFERRGDLSRAGSNKRIEDLGRRAVEAGFKCAGGLILSWLKRESPGVGAKVEFAINLPNCKEFGPKVGVGNQSK